MRITKKVVKDILQTIEETKQKIKEKEKQKYPYTEWERQRVKIRQRLQKLPEYIQNAAGTIQIKYKTGRQKKLNLIQRTTLFLFVRTLNKSNRDFENLLGLLEPLFGFKVSYKYIERLYSDEEVKLALHNLFYLLLHKESISGNFAGDGTGYSLLVSKHYKSNPHKRSKDYKYVFRLIDLDTGMYVAYGYSNRSEMDAFNSAMEMLENHGVEINSIVLDRYYSSRKILKLFGRRTTVFVIPKKNIARIGLEWSRVLRNILEEPAEFVSHYYKRNLSEAGFSSDKRRFGWQIRQVREDRRQTAMSTIALLHNIHSVRVQIE